MSDSRGWVPDEEIEKLTLMRAIQKDEDPVKIASKIIKDNLPLAAMSMAFLAIHSHTEMVRFNASKYLMDKAFDPKGSVPDAQPAWQKVFENAMSELE